MMRMAIWFGLLVLFLQILSLVGVSRRHLDLQHVQNPRSLQISHISIHQGHEEEIGVRGRRGKEINKIGSRPPSCEHKCYGCMPCQAIQVPMMTGRVGVRYTNYEPEGWKCKCGPTFYSP